MSHSLRQLAAPAAFLGLFLTCAGDTPGPTPPVGQVSVRLETVATGLNLPVLVTAAPGDTGRIFVVEKGGKVRIIE
ncbi:MAG TPA: hypothetical protein PKA66_11315, partial [Gemmatimonadales bacterium]|nr:hypothetical protein [Gemmatimonadales bacterium]